MKVSQIISFASFVFGTQALVAAPRDARLAIEGEVKRDAEAAPAAEPDYGLCVVGIDSPCNGDAADKGGADGRTWENHHRFHVGKDDAADEDGRDERPFRIGERDAQDEGRLSLPLPRGPYWSSTFEEVEKREAEPVPASVDSE